MNFDSEADIDKLIARLLVFVMMFQKKIQQLKCKLAGNEQFHTRLAFQALDLSRKNQIDSETLSTVFRNSSQEQSEDSYSLFLRRYSKNGVLTYDEFLRLVTPKGNKTYAQRLLIRSYPRGAKLDDNLQRYLVDLLWTYVKMCCVTEQLRVTIQRNQDLSYSQLIVFFRNIAPSGGALAQFLYRCGGDEVESSDATFLSYHTQSGNYLADFTDMDIKEVLCPIDMNFQKPVPRHTFYKQTANPASETATSQTKQGSFLGQTYQKIYHRNESSGVSMASRQNVGANSGVRSDKLTLPNRYPSAVEKSSLSSQSYGGMYIDNFINQPSRAALELNDYISPGRSRRQEFPDELGSNFSSISRQSRGSAFDRG